MGVSAAVDRSVNDGLEEFVSSIYRRLVGLLVLRAGNQGVAEELAQESLLKLVKHWDRVRVMDNPWAWLATVAVNQSTSRWRRLAMVERVEGGLMALPDRVDSQGSLAELLMVVDTLPERQRAALLLRHYARLSVRETAVAMGCAEGTVKSLTSRAVERLRAELSEEVEHALD